MSRVFVFGDDKYDDPGESFSPSDVLALLASTYPQLAEATIEENEEDGITTYTFVPKPKRLG